MKKWKWTDWEAYKEMLKKTDKQKWIVCILTGCLLLVIAIPVEKQDTEKERENYTQDSSLPDSYERQLEQRVEDLIRQMDGVGEVEVMVTLADDGERIVAQDSNRKTSSQNKGDETSQEVIVESETVFSGENPYRTKSISPEIRGICVVAQGVGNNETRVRVYEAVQALFSLEAHKISIVEMGSQEGT